MKKFVLLFTVLVASLSFGDKASALIVENNVSYTEICFNGSTFCGVVSFVMNRGIARISASPGYTMPKDFDYRVTVSPLNITWYNTLKSKGMETANMTVEQFKEQATSGYDRQIQHNSDKCLWEGIGCGGGLVAAMLTSPWGIPLALAACKVARLDCEDLDAANVELGQKRLDLLEQLKSEKSGHGGSHQGSGGGGGETPGGSPSPGQPGTIFGPEPDTSCRKCRITDGHD